MKKLAFAVVFTVIFTAGLPVFAQTIPADRESDFYFVNVSLEKIWPHRAGYVVQYRTGIHGIGRTYLPREWFDTAFGKGEIITLPRGRSWPSMTVFYRNGEFSHVRLYVHRWQSHQTWGSVPQNINLDSSFIDIEDIRLNFR